MWNLLNNIAEDRFWAGGNWFLLWNTWVSLFQGLCSFLLVAEFPTYLGSKEHFESHLLRGFSASLAFIYDLVYGYFFLELFYSMYTADDSYTVLNLITDLFIAFNILMHGPIFMINAVILYKEIRFEYGYGDRIGWSQNQYKDLALGIDDLMYGLEDAFNLLNPFWWFNRIFLDV